MGVMGSSHAWLRYYMALLLNVLVMRFTTHRQLQVWRYSFNSLQYHSFGSSQQYHSFSSFQYHSFGSSQQYHSFSSFQCHQLRMCRYSFDSFVLLITVSSVYSIVDFVCGVAVSLQFHYSFVLLITVSSVYSIVDFACGAAVSLQYHSCSVALQFTCVVLLFTVFSVCSIAFLTGSALQFTWVALLFTVFSVCSIAFLTVFSSTLSALWCATLPAALLSLLGLES